MSVRQDLESDIYELCDDIDPSGKNRKRMKEYLDKMSDTQFTAYMVDFLSNPDINFTFAIDPLESSRTFEDYAKIGKKYNITMSERVYRPYLNMDQENPAGCQEETLVFPIEEKRLQQLLHKKNSTSTSISRRNPKTGQVSDADKNAAASDNEMLSFQAQNRIACAVEYAGFRADDQFAKSQAYSMIQKNGSVSLKDLDMDPINRTTIKTMYYFMLGAGIYSNLIEPTGYVAPITLKAKEERQTTARHISEG